MSKHKATTEEAVAYLESISAPITEDRILWARFLATQPTVEQVNIASSLVIEDRARHLPAARDVWDEAIRAARSAFDQQHGDSQAYHGNTMVNAGAMERRVVAALEAARDASTGREVKENPNANG